MGPDCRNILVPTGFKPSIQIPPQQKAPKAPRLQTPDSRLSDLQAVPATWTRFPTVMRIPPPHTHGQNTTQTHSSSTHAYTRPDHSTPLHEQHDSASTIWTATGCISLESSLGLDRSCAWARNQHQPSNPAILPIPSPSHVAAMPPVRALLST